jgi:hypothetical protein
LGDSLADLVVAILLEVIGNDPISLESIRKSDNIIFGNIEQTCDSIRGVNRIPLDFAPNDGGGTDLRGAIAAGPTG